MKIAFKIVFVFLVIVFSGCKKFLDRPPLTSETDETAWTSEEKLRLYANKYYTDFFDGYGNGFTTTGAPLVGYTNSDDMVVQGNQPNFTRSVPNSSIWSYTTIRSVNIMLDRIETKMSGILSTEAKAHWTGVGRFFRGFRYSELVQSYGDVPYYTREIQNTELGELYKARTPRNEVMDGAYDDWKFALQNVRLNDGDQNLNRYIVAGFVSRLALIEGTWQKYYYKSNERAKKFLDLAVEAADMVISSGKYDITTDYKTLFTSKELKGNKECILYRNYDPAAGVTHAIASYGNLAESTTNGPTSDLIKSYILNTGGVWQNASSAIQDFNLDNLIKTRDSRFEATFYSKPSLLNKGSFYYITKFLPRDVEKRTQVDLLGMPPEFVGDKNETDAPVLRYAEVLLNWVEAKAELATIGGTALVQNDIDKTINKIRSRPLAAEAITRGVVKTTNLSLAALPTDPDRDPDVSSLIWEIRRERRMEFAFEIFRLADLKRWSKLQYMDNSLNTDLLSGGWVNFPTQLPGALTAANIGIVSVVDLNGTETVYNGTNAAAMKGFYKNTINKGRLPFLNQPNINPYLTPVGLVQMDDYAAKGYKLTQTQGWPQN
ncbi:RagB/SusD family nutrient uptake outer membrane protein [Pedobacter heparinus]|uniref:RagB/SusD domain protein n=1 Tax=Pedobacter heparinus (strain ATCC 13125 / DSM 2366 / CIP 104194 / JCM 7457 / NBRC 12017 / NCIMB 9290 / NRRL B-14731 / HIM 762-3) TaxID=485917 RepID=C6XWM7_PEDHD|nr:RagB/SusD family nutrient uptake outer membrane protein [Pedobacter heparinus]ACU06316.1 RagB/SusD domain protein [Pedobacter heparinus DSM 2366]